MNIQINERQKKEKNRLKKIYKTLPEDRRKNAEKLIERAAYMLYSLQEMEQKIDEDGLLITMSQGKYDIERAHPLLSAYNAMVKNYTAVIKQLNDMLPPTEQDSAGQALMAFVTKTVQKK